VDAGDEPTAPPAPLWQGRPLAHWRLRAGASLVDLGLALVVVQFADAILGSAGASDRSRTLFLLFGTLVLWALMQTVAMGVTRGQTIGKRIFGLRVLRADGTPAGLGIGVLRELVCRVPFAVPVVFLVDALVPLRADRRSLRDRMARTGVVEEPPAVGANRLRAITMALILVGVGAIVGTALNGDLITSDRGSFISDCTGQGDSYSACDCTWKQLTRRIGAKRLDQVSNEDVTPADVQAATSAAYAACR
jgi:uncharacterized RDD family membrane protein YckC